MKLSFPYVEKNFCTCGKIFLYVMKNSFARDEKFVCTYANFIKVNSYLLIPNS